MRSKKALRNVITSVILQACSIICGFIIPKLIISNYGSVINGLIVSITHFLSCITLLEAGFGPVIKADLYKPIAQKDNEKIKQILKASEKIFRTISYIFLVYIILLCIVLPLNVSSQFDYIFTILLIIIISLSTFAEYYFGMTYRLYLQADQKAYVVNCIQIVTTIVNAILIILLINLKMNIIIVKLVSSIIFVLRPILQNIYVKRKYNINLKNVKLEYKLKQKWDALVQHIAYIIHNNADIVILMIFGNLIEISVYSIYSSIVNSIKRALQSFSNGIDSAFGNMIANNEKENLNKSFKMYEGIYLTITTILFSSTLFLIIPFIKIYTKGIDDADYIRTTFASVIVIAEFFCMIRLPYNDLVKVAGKFKETKKGAYIEAILNIVISCILVNFWGITGVAIGTLVAMCIRTIEFMYYSGKYILNRDVFYGFKRLVVIAVEVILITFCVEILPKGNVDGYFTWIIQAIEVCIVSTVVVVFVNSLVYKENLQNIFNKVKTLIKNK